MFEGKLRRSLVTALLAGVCLVAIACGGDSGVDSTGNPSTGGANADLRLLGSDPVPSLDPAICGNTSCGVYIQEIFGGLVTIDRDLKIIPDIAESWDISSDGTVYTFKLRRNAQFHDGKPVTADDFKYSLDRAAKLGQTDSATAEAYLGDIVGARDVTRGRAQSISGVEVVDSSTLKITIDAPKAYFLAKLTYPTAFVVDKQQVESNPRNWARKPNATGPYKLADYRLNERIILESHDRYHLGAPSVKRVLYNLAGGSSLTQYENNEIDVSGIGLNDIERVQSGRDALSKEYKSGQNLSISYIGFNTKQPPFDDIKVRQAFAMAIDKEQIARVVLKNMFPVANSIMQPGLPGYNQNARAPAFNPERARQLLSESKYRDARGLGPVTLTEIGGGATVGFDTQAMLEQWKNNLGVDVTIAQSETGSFFDDLDRGRLQMFSIGWIMDYPDPENIIDLLFNSNSRQNNTGYTNEQVNALTQQARSETDVTRRLQLYQQAEAIILEESPWIPLYFGRDHFVVKPYVKGYEPQPILIPFLRHLKIEK